MDTIWTPKELEKIFFNSNLLILKTSPTGFEPVLPPWKGVLSSFARFFKINKKSITYCFLRKFLLFLFRFYKVNLDQFRSLVDTIWTPKFLSTLKTIQWLSPNQKFPRVGKFHFKARFSLFYESLFSPTLKSVL